MTASSQQLAEELQAALQMLGELQEKAFEIPHRRPGDAALAARFHALFGELAELRDVVVISMSLLSSRELPDAVALDAARRLRAEVHRARDVGRSSVAGGNDALFL